MTTTWFTSDLHLGHKTVAKLRGYDDPEIHDSMILSGIAQNVSKGDNLWILGDLSSGGSTGQRRALTLLKSFADDLGIHIHLISGNHDGVHPLHRDSHKWISRYAQAFESVQPFSRRRLAGRNLWLSHFPWRGGGDHTEGERYSTVRLNDDGTSWLLHGHTHNPAPIRPEERMIHVGVEAWCFQPVSIHEIEELIREHDVPAAPSQPNEQEDEMTSPITSPRPRLRPCIAAWPECSPGEYDPSCCRFPNPCSCTSYPNDINPKHLEYPLSRSDS